MAERERAAVQVARRAAAISTPTRPDTDRPGLGASARTTVLLLLAICVVGVGPLLVVTGIFGALHVNMPPVPGLSLFAPSATEATDLALPRQAWAAVRVNVIAQPGGSSQLATLEPGFPVTMTAHQKVGSTVWSHITWDGPTKASGGEGWAPDSAFVSYGGQGRPIGDVGALSPQLMTATAPYGSKFAAALYFPESGQLYRSGADQSFTLGDGFRAVLLAAIFAWNEEAGRRIGTAVTATTAAGIARDDASAASFAYGAVGDKAGISAYLTKLGIAGIQPAQGNWQGAQATPNALVEFYTALARKQILNDTDRATVATLLGHVTSPLSTQMSAMLSPGNGGFFVVGVSQGAGGWTMSVCAIIVSAHGSRVVLAAVVRNQPTQAAAEAGLVAFYRQLATLMSAA
ncbi:MAG: hypothetical protein ACXWQR_03860 [Ktedonobacterales bacterium]